MGGFCWSRASEWHPKGDETFRVPYVLVAMPFCIVKRYLVGHLEAKINTAAEKAGVTVAEGMHQDITAIMKSENEKVISKYPASSFQLLFLEQQLKAASCIKVQGMRWHLLMICWCLYLRRQSSSSYGTHRDSGVIVLLSQHTLHDYTNNICSWIIMVFHMKSICSWWMQPLSKPAKSGRSVLCFFQKKCTYKKTLFKKTTWLSSWWEAPSCTSSFCTHNTWASRSPETSSLSHSGKLWNDLSDASWKSLLQQLMVHQWTVSSSRWEGEPQGSEPIRPRSSEGLLLFWPSPSHQNS